MDETTIAVTDPVSTAYVESTDTQNQPSASPAEELGGHDEAATETQAPASNEGIPEDKDTIIARQRGQLEKVRKDAEEAQRKADLIQKERDDYYDRFNKVAGHVARDPESYKKALMDLNGLTDAQADAEIQKYKAQGAWNYQTNTPTQPITATQSNLMDPSQIDALVSQKVSEQLEKKEATDALIEINPELKTNSPENMENYKKSYYLAQAMIQVNPGLPLKNALIDAYSIQTRKATDQIAAARTAGRNEGMAEAIVAQASTSSAVIGETPRTQNSTLSAKDREYAKMVGMSEDAYAKRKSESITQID